MNKVEIEQCLKKRLDGYIGLPNIEVVKQSLNQELLDVFNEIIKDEFGEPESID